MSKKKPFSTLTGFALGALLVAVAGTGIALWTGFNLNQRGIPNNADLVKPEPPIPGQPQTYWLTPDTTPSDDPAEVAFTPRNLLPTATTPTGKLEQAFTVLLQPAPTATTAIPEETRLLALREDSRGVYVDLSPEFLQGGGTQAMIARLGQVIYTATSLDPEEEVWISVQGEPLTVLGGEGLEVEQPMTRQKFERDFLHSSQQ